MRSCSEAPACGRWSGRPPVDKLRAWGDAIWWAITTLTTTGYGEHYPVTVGGRVIAVALMISGIVIIGAVAATAGMAPDRRRDGARLASGRYPLPPRGPAVGHPLTFATGSPERLARIARETADHGFRTVPPHPADSDARTANARTTHNHLLRARTIERHTDENDSGTLRTASGLEVTLVAG